MEPTTIHELRQRLLAWYGQNRRVLPWRATPGAPAEPYHVLVSEFMLQQTTVATVIPRFVAFTARFPTLDALARADVAEVLHEWQGLGYYRRARALHACARAVHTEHGGTIPRDVATLRRLPGIGAYTAAAVAAIAFDQPAVPMDGNAERVFARLGAETTPLPQARKALAAFGARFADPQRPGDFAQALMDLGATLCTPRRPRCLLCPWQVVCAARAQGIAAELPRKAAKLARPARHALAFLATAPDGSVLFRLRPPDGLLGGTHELPATAWQADPPVWDAALAEAPCPGAWRLLPGTVTHGFTHMTIRFHLASAAVAKMEANLGIWCPPEAFGTLILPTMTKRLLRHAGYLKDTPSRPVTPRGARS